MDVRGLTQRNVFVGLNVWHM